MLKAVCIHVRVCNNNRTDDILSVTFHLPMAFLSCFQLHFFDDLRCFNEKFCLIREAVLWYKSAVPLIGCYWVVKANNNKYSKALSDPGPLGFCCHCVFAVIAFLLIFGLSEWNNSLPTLARAEVWGKNIFSALVQLWYVLWSFHWTSCAEICLFKNKLANVFDGCLCECEWQNGCWIKDKRYSGLVM